MSQLAVLLSRLRPWGVTRPSDYAEVLVAEGLGGQRNKRGIEKGYDVIAPRHGKIEVKCRVLPVSGRKEERVAVGEGKISGFEHLAIVIFMPDFHVNGAVLVPYNDVWTIVADHKYHRISYADACRLSGAVDITDTDPD